MKNENLETQLFDVAKVAQHPEVAQVNGVTLEDDGKTFCTYRLDSGKKLGTVGMSYNILQNSEIYRMCQDAAELAKLDPEAIKFLPLQGGRKVSFQIQLPDWVIGGNDKVGSFYSFMTSHDGSTGTGHDILNTRIICMNTWRMAMKEAKRFKHTVGGNNSVRLHADIILQSIEESSLLEELFETMHAKPFEYSDSLPFVLDVLGYDSEEVKESTRKANKVEKFMEGMRHELLSVGMNEWGAFNGITWATNHIIERDDQLTYNYLKEGHTLSNRAIEVLTA